LVGPGSGVEGGVRGGVGGGRRGGEEDESSSDGDGVRGTGEKKDRKTK